MESECWAHIQLDGRGEEVLWEGSGIERVVVRWYEREG
jgi:hypothetical protein